MEETAFDGKVECKEKCIRGRGTNLTIHAKYINTNNEKDNIIATVIIIQYISKITIVLNAGATAQPFLFPGFSVFLGIPFVPVIAWSAAIPVGV